ncbi:helix-turn-helix domain-containing protein [Kibdelosporangium lantanae]|uniref:Helix-turn-helix domain-containing protein n=1 Tax=Kibdelosporangium lantanae TaxID=1497396 RepID=A0ABW3MB95_9PSEU
MGRARQTFERRQLGLTLRRLRERAEHTQQAAADAIGRVRSRIVELEEGKGTLNQTDLKALLNFYEVQPDTLKTVLALGVKARRRQRNRPYIDQLPDSYLRFADLEASASEIRVFESGLVPGLLQSPEYMQAVIREGDGIWWDQLEGEPDDRISFRQDRQTRTWDTSTSRVFHFVIAEEALRSNVGGDPAVMRAQLRHILTLLTERDNLTIQVLPQNTPSNPVRGGGFSLFLFGDRALPVGVAHVVFGPEQYFDDPVDTAALDRAFTRLRDELALDGTKSAIAIRSILEGLPDPRWSNAPGPR